MNNQVLDYVKSSVKKLRKYNPNITKVYPVGSCYLILKEEIPVYPNDIDVAVNLSEIQNKIGVDMVTQSPLILLYTPVDLGDNVYLTHPVDQCIDVFTKLNCTTGKYYKWMSFYLTLSENEQKEVLDNLNRRNINKMYILNIK